MQFFSLILAAVAALIPIAALGDSVSLYGLQFPVDNVTPIDGSSVKVALGSETQIVQKSSLSNFVVKKTLQDRTRALRFSSAALQQFVEAAIAAKDTDPAAWGIQALFWHLESEQAAVGNYLGALADRAEASDAVKAALSDPATTTVPDEVWARLAVGISPRNLPWLQVKFPALPAPLQARVRDELQQHVLAALRSRNFVKLDEYLTVQRGVLGEQDSATRDITILTTRLREALDRAGHGEVDPLFALVGATKGNKELSELIAPFVTDAVHQEVSAELKRGEATRALLLLSRSDFERRTPQTHDLTKIALERMVESNETPLVNSGVDLFLRRLAEVDPRVKETYIAALDKQIPQLLESGRLDIAADYVGKLARVRRDPSVENDSLRFLQALEYLKRGMRASAFQAISEIQTGISLFGRLQLAASGYYGDPLTAIVVLLVPLLIILFIWLRHRAPILLGSDSKPELPEDEEEDESSRPGGFAISGSRLMSPSMQEYNRCLHALGLKPGASLRQVKSHYRSLIKKVHPDLNKNLSAAERERFVTLTKMYDRLIELRRELKFPES